MLDRSSVATIALVIAMGAGCFYPITTQFLPGSPRQQHVAAYVVDGLLIAGGLVAVEADRECNFVFDACPATRVGAFAVVAGVVGLLANAIRAPAGEPQ